MPWQFWLMLAGIVVMSIGGFLAEDGGEGATLALVVMGFVAFVAGGVMMPDPPLDRADAARATIAAATAAVTGATAESELRALERAAATAAAAVKGVGR